MGQATFGALCCAVCGYSVAASLAQAQPASAPPAIDDEVVATGRRAEAPTEPTALTEKLVRLPGNFGDPLRAVAALPGVVQTSESGRPAVRGSSPDDNAFLVDGLPAGYVFHELGDSIFNEDVVRDFGFTPAGFGARHGEASGALFDIALRAPRNEPLLATVDLSLLRAGALLESRITDNQAFYVSFREDLLHLLLDQAYGEEERLEDDVTIDRYPQARDLQAKYTWDSGARHAVSFLALASQDDAAATFGARSDRALLDPGSRGAAAATTAFASAGASWIYRSDDVTVTTRLGRLAKQDDLGRGGGNEHIDLELEQWTAKSTAEWPMGARQHMALGVEHSRVAYDYAVRMRYRACTAFSPNCDTTLGDLTEADGRQAIGTTAAFLESRFSLRPSIELTGGIRYSRDDYLESDFLEPRLAVVWRRSPRTELRAAWGRYHQLPEIVQIVPELGNPALRPFEAEHFVLGVKRTFADDWWLNIELYEKRLEDLVVETDAPIRYVNHATGHARGIELMVMRESGARWYGWGTLSVAETERRNGLTGRTAKFDTDTPVIANIVLNYQLTPTWNLGLRWQYRSGLPYTPIVGNEENPDYPGFYRPVYGDLNAERASAYHRLDVRLERPIRIARVEGLFYVDIVNAYGRRNTGAAGYEPVAGSSEYRLVEEEGLPFLPSVGVKLKLGAGRVRGADRASQP
ncbi:MAG TPA: TonB-dependent receptor [Gammaproteobacteria bacterium]